MAFFVVLGSAWVLGTLVLRRSWLGGIVEDVVFRLYTGLVLSAVLVMVVGSVSLRAVQWVLYPVAFFGLAWEVFVHYRFPAPSAPQYLRRPPAPLAPLDKACLGILGCVGVLSLVSALAPVTSWDAAGTHLALPQDYARAGRILLVEGNEYCAFPHLAHSLFAYAFFESGETAVTLLNGLFGLLGCGAAFALGRRVESFRCGLLAATTFATAPIFMDQVGGASLDLAFAGITVAALSCLMAWYEEETRGWLVLGSFLAGSSCGIRHTGYLICAFLALGVLLATSPSRREALTWFSGISLVAALPWLVRSAILTANPIYPFFGSILSSEILPAEETATFGSHSSIAGTGLVDLLMFPWNIIMRPHWFDGWSKSPGGLVLILGVPGFLIGGKRARWLGAYSLAGGFCFFYFQQSARYLLPFFVPVMVIAAIGACRLMPHFGRCLAAVLVTLFAYGLVLDVAAVHFKFPVVVGLESREAYLDRRVERYAAFRWVNERLPDSAVVLTLDERSYYFKMPTYRNREALKLLRGKSFEEQLAWLKARGITHLFYPRTHVEQESHGLANLGLPALVNGWIRHARHFVPVASFDLARPRTDGAERVEVYEIHYEKARAMAGHVAT